MSLFFSWLHRCAPARANRSLTFQHTHPDTGVPLCLLQLQVTQNSKDSSMAKNAWKTERRLFLPKTEKSSHSHGWFTWQTRHYQIMNMTGSQNFKTKMWNDIDTAKANSLSCTWCNTVKPRLVLQFFFLLSVFDLSISDWYIKPYRKYLQ